MKSCPTCNKTFTDPNLSFCLDDGTPLVLVAESADETTVVSPSSGSRPSDPSPTEVYTPRDWQAPDYQPPGFQVAPGEPRKRKTWPWVVGILAVLVISLIGLGIVAAMLVPNMMRAASNRNSANANVELSSNSNSNLNSSAPVSNSNTESTPENTNTLADEGAATPPPTDKDKVLVDLTELEHDWTVANINADKRQLDRILADDYVGMTTDGKSQGKAEYIRTIERDTTIEKWDFEDLQVNLKGDRATLEGVIRLQLRDQEPAAFRFTDKFVWRDGRWQAVGSEVSRIK